MRARPAHFNPNRSAPRTFIGWLKLGYKKMQAIRLVYFSKAAGTLNDADLEAILEKSRQNNAQSGITGLLLLVNGVFVQVLEGPKHAVLPLVEKIHGDPRHTDLRVVHEEDLAEPLFCDWKMAYLNDDLAELLKAAGLVDSESALELFASAENERIATGSTSSALSHAVSRAIDTYARRLREHSRHLEAV